MRTGNNSGRIAAAVPWMFMAASIGSAALPSLAAAESSDTLSDIIVTAQKREQNLQEVGTSVTAFDDKALASVGLKDVVDIASQVPGLQFNQYGATVTIYNLRGVSQNDFSDHQEAPIAVYSDEAYIANTGALAGALFDLQRVEVLRGPQGTLFGRNATGGLIQYISQKPTDTPEAYLQLSGGSYNTFQSEGAVSGPISDTLSSRFSIATSNHAGYINNPLGADINNERLYAGRLQFLYKPSDKGEVLVKFHALNDDSETSGNYSWGASSPDATGRGVFTPGATDYTGYINTSTSPFTQFEKTPGRFNRTVWGSTVKVDWNFDAFSLVSVTDYLSLQKRYSEDSSISPDPTFTYITGVHYQQYSEEVRLNGTVGALRWITGLYYLNYKTTNFETTLLPDYIDSIPFPYGNGYANLGLRDSSPSIFGQVEYDFNDHWTGIIGARFTEDRKQYVYNYSCNVCAGGFPYSVTYSTPAGFPQAEKTDDLPTGKVELDYKFNPDVMAYASVNRGAKGGGWSAPSSGYVNLDPAFTAVPVINLHYNKETLTSYETGVKSTFWNGAARLNASAFYYDYHNYQGFFLDVATQIVENINATVWGSEIEFSVIPMHGLNVQLGISQLDSRAVHVPTPAGDFVTSQMPQAPELSVNGLVHYEWPAYGGNLSVELDGKWNKQQYLELENAQVDREASYAVYNTRFGYTAADGRWDVFGYVRNLADRWYRVYNLDLSGFLGLNQAVYGPPRTFGASFSYHWGK